MKCENEESMSQMHNQWLKHQNVWQQIRHGLSGPWGNRRRWWLVLSAKVLTVLLVVAAFALYLLPSYTRSDHYKKEARVALENALCLERKAASFNLQSHNMRDWTIPSLRLKGNERTFFKTLDAKNVKGKASLLAGLLGSWRPYSLTIDSLHILTQNDVLPGVERYDTLFQPFWVRELTIRSLSLRWAENNYSSWLEGCSCRAVFKKGQWVLHLKGGTMHSSMFTHCRLIEAHVVLTPDDKIIIESCQFQVIPTELPTDPGVTVELDGTIEWKNDAPPQLAAHLKSGGILLQKFVSIRLGDIVSGTFEAEGTLTGPFNVPSEWVGRFQLRNQGPVEIANVPLLQKLDEMLIHKTYRNMTCPEFSFEALFSYRTQTWQARRISIRSAADDDVRITGSLSSRTMTDKEWKKLCKRFPGRVNAFDEAMTDSKIMYFTGGGARGKSQEDDGGMFTRLTPLFEGEIAISLPKNALGALLPIMERAMPTRSEGDRLIIDLPVGDVVSEVGKNEAEHLQNLWINSRREQIPIEE